MMLSIGEKIFVIARRRFENDIRRHFIGEVQNVSETAVRVCGYAFVFDNMLSEFVKGEDLLTRIYPMIDAGLVISVLPREVILEEVRYSMNEKKQRIITDDKTFEISVSEFGLKR
jgi:hypothetical protein